MFPFTPQTRISSDFALHSTIGERLLGTQLDCLHCLVASHLDGGQGDLRQKKYEGKENLGREKRHKRGGLKQKKLLKCMCLGRNIRNINVWDEM